MTKPPANAFEWKRYVVEEAVRRGEKPAINEDYKRSVAATKAVEKKRLTDPTYGTLGMSGKTAEMIALKPKTFTIYSRARKKGLI
jgi:hypothetical protein